MNDEGRGLDLDFGVFGEGVEGQRDLGVELFGEELGDLEGVDVGEEVVGELFEKGGNGFHGVGGRG